MRSQKVRLKFNKEQEELAWWYSKVSRRFWNLLVVIDRKNNDGEFDDYLKERGNKTYYSEYFKRDIYRLSKSDYLRLAELYAKENPDILSWYDRPNQSFIYSFLARELIKIKKQNKGKVNFRSIEKVAPTFNVRCDSIRNKKKIVTRPSRIYLKDNGKLQIPTLGEVKIGKTRSGFDLSCKKQVATISFDGKYWYLSYMEPCDTSNSVDAEWSDGIGIDLGIKDLAVMSDGTIVKNIKTLRRIRILNKRLKRYQRKLSRKYLINKSTKRNKTKNIIKLERKIKLIHRRIKNIRLNHVREFVSKVVKKQPLFIALEDLNVKGMMKNKHLAKDIANCAFYMIREHFTRKAKERNIAVRIVNRFYPSSKTCSNCGYIKRDLKLKDRIYHCSHCGIHLDRDFNASINLAQTTSYTLA